MENLKPTEIADEVVVNGDGFIERTVILRANPAVEELALTYVRRAGVSFGFRRGFSSGFVWGMLAGGTIAVALYLFGR